MLSAWIPLEQRRDTAERLRHCFGIRWIPAGSRVVRDSVGAASCRPLSPKCELQRFAKERFFGERLSLLPNVIATLNKCHKWKKLHRKSVGDAGACLVSKAVTHADVMTSPPSL